MLSSLLLAVAASAVADVPAHYAPGSRLLQARKPSVSADTQAAAVAALVERFLPGRSGDFSFQITGTDGDSFEAVQDKFELQYTKGKPLVVRGSTGVALAAGWYSYMTQYANCSVTWGVNGTGDRMVLPTPIPAIPGSGNVKGSSAALYMYYMNVCTVSYSSAWWDWPRWEREIDWMALHGVNLPLSFTGQESVWYRLFTEVGLTESEIQDWLAGPAFLAWQRMGNLRKWAGPLTASWMDRQAALQRKILQRQRALGMVPVLPGFGGHVPAALGRVYPKANLTKSANWWGATPDLCCVTLLQPLDPLFTTLGKRFYELVDDEFGSSGIFNADTWNEMDPGSSDPGFLKDSAAAVYGALAAFDPKAVWLMQGWLFVASPNFWRPAQVEAYLSGAPDDGMLILDLWAELHPVWPSTKSFYGKPFIWSMLHDFGGRRALFGNLTHIATAPATAVSRGATSLVGYGLTPEAIENNPVVYELMTEMNWRGEPVPDVDAWLAAYANRRYGTEAAAGAWKTLHGAVYDYGVIQAALFQMSPTFQAASLPGQDPAALVTAWRQLVAALNGTGPLTGPQSYDVVDVTRQVYANAFVDLHGLLCGHLGRHEPGAVKALSASLQTLLRHLDALLATDPNYLLGAWVRAAAAWAKPGEQPLEQLLFNALNQLTLWGPRGNIDDYAAKHWSGLVKDYYLPRWEKALQAAVAAAQDGTEVNETAVKAADLAFGEAWGQKRSQGAGTQWPDTPAGDTRAEVDRAMQALGTASGSFTAKKGFGGDPAHMVYVAQVTDPAWLSVLCDVDPACGAYTSQGQIFAEGFTQETQPGVTLFVKDPK